MLKTKLKTCDGCEKPSVIWKNDKGFRYCKQCWYAQKSNDGTEYKIPQVSSKRQKKDAEYSKLRAKFLNEYSMCQVKVAGCMNGATDVHHTYAGANRDAFYLVQSTWKAVCRNCHNWIHDNPEQAKIMNWLK